MSHFNHLFMVILNIKASKLNLYRNVSVSSKVKADWSITLNRLIGKVHPKMNILSSFTHLHVVPNLYKFISYVKHRRYSEE